VFWSFVLCLWSDHSKFIFLIYGFNFWRVSGFIIVCRGCFNFFRISCPTAIRGLDLRVFSGIYLNKISVSMTPSDGE